MNKNYLLAPNFKIKLFGDVSERFLLHKIKSFHEAIEWIHQLPYGRNTNRADYLSIFDEFRGTCSTKHAVLAALADEHHQEVQLKMVICKLDQNVDKTVGKLLLQLKVPYFPEAHCYIKCNKGALDLTFPDQDVVPRVSVLKEYDISPKDIGDKKVSIHHEYIKFWMKDSMFSQQYSFDEVWELRERWIQSLSQS
jgi:hypothetical protein